MSALPFAVFQPVPLRELRPGGWLTDFLQRQASGLTGYRLGVVATLTLKFSY